MNRNACIIFLLAVTLVVLSGCSSQPSADQAKKAVTLDKIQGKAQVGNESGQIGRSRLVCRGPHMSSNLHMIGLASQQRSQDNLRRLAIAGAD